jgi:hypothetical protein
MKPLLTLIVWWLAAAIASAAPQVASKQAQQPDVFLVTIDTLRDGSRPLLWRRRYSHTGAGRPRERWDPVRRICTSTISKADGRVPITNIVNRDRLQP